VNATEMDDVLTRAERVLGQRWVAVMDWLRSQNQLQDIEAKLRAGAFDEAIASLEQAAQRWAAVTQQEYVTAAMRMSNWIEDKTGLPVDFDQANTRAMAWAQANQLDLVRRVTVEQRETMRQVIAEGVRRGQNPRETARDIREAIGLTPRQEQYVQSYRNALESGNFSNALSRELRDGRTDRVIERLQRDGGSLSQSQIDRNVTFYRQSMSTMRSETIARTEALRVVHQGADEQINQAIESGDLPASAVVRTWVSTRDLRTRDTHRVMNGQERVFGEVFRTGGGKYLAYPGDPDGPPEETINCRCVLTTRLRFGKILEFRKQRGLFLPARLIAA
jgi:hypothetical protein